MAKNSNSGYNYKIMGSFRKHEAVTFRTVGRNAGGRAFLPPRCLPSGSSFCGGCVSGCRAGAASEAANCAVNSEGLAAQVLAEVNTRRAEAGVPAVNQSVPLATGRCSPRRIYLVANASLWGTGFDAHYETLDLPRFLCRVPRRARRRRRGKPASLRLRGRSRTVGGSELSAQSWSLRGSMLHCIGARHGQNHGRGGVRLGFRWAEPCICLRCGHRHYYASAPSYRHPGVSGKRHVGRTCRMGRQ
jgi:hypothetical protein